MADIKIGLQSTLDTFKENTSKKSEVKKGSAAEAAGQTKKVEKPKTKREVKLPNVQMMSYQTESPENRSSKYPGLSIQEEIEIDSNPQLSRIGREKVYKEMFGKKQQDAWLEDRSKIRNQYISGEASTGTEEDDNVLVSLSQTMDGVREYIVQAGGKGVNKVGDMELLNAIGETNPYAAQIVNSVVNGDMDAEYGAYFLLNEDVYEEAMKQIAQDSPAGLGEEGKIENTEKRKAGRLESFIEGPAQVVKGATKNLTKLGISALALPAMGVEYLLTGDAETTKGIRDKAKGVIDEATTMTDEWLNSNRKLRQGYTTAGKILGEAGLAALTSAGGGAILGKLGGTAGTALANTKAGLPIYKAGTALENFGQTGVGKVANWIGKRAVNAIEGGATVQGISDLVEGELSDKKDYRNAMLWGLALDGAGALVGGGLKKFANPGTKITEIVKGKGGLNAKQINQIENEIKAVHSTNKAENPFRTRATEAKQALPKLKDDINTVSEQRNQLTKSLKNDGNPSTYDYLDELNATLTDTDLGNIKIIKDKKGKWKVSGGTTAGSEAEKQLKEFVDMINAQSDKGTKSLADTIAAAKQIAKEAQIAGHTNKMTRAISEFSTKLEEDAKALYPDIWGEIGKKNEQLSELLGMRNKLLELGDDYSAIAGKMNSDTDFYRFMDDLYTKGYTKEHIGNKTLGTYYTMGLRTPELLTEQAKLFYPSVPGLEEAGLRYFQKQAKQAYGGLGALAGQDVYTPVGAWSKMASSVGQQGLADNR